MAFAEQGASLSRPSMWDSLITIPNDKLLKVLGRYLRLDAFGAANDVPGAVQGIAELITRPV